jgi:drug/metabolite transporter (DMT)-like permease
VVLGIVLAVAASVAYGLSDVLSGSAVRHHSTASVALWSQITALVPLGLIALVVRPALVWPAIGWGLAAGALASVALLLFYTALQRGRTAVVAPVAGAGVAIPVVAGLLGGASLGWTVVVGVAVVVAGVLVVAATGDGDGPDTSGRPDPDPPHRRLIRSSPAAAHPVPVHDECVPEPDVRSTRTSVILAALAAVGFGAFFVVLDLATSAAGTGVGPSVLGPSVMVTVAVQFGALAVTLPTAAVHTRACLAPTRRLLLAAGAVGLTDVVGDLAVVGAVGIGPLAVVGPLSSLDPVVSVVVAVAVLGERPRLWQAVGIAAVLVGVVLVATG